MKSALESGSSSLVQYALHSLSSGQELTFRDEIEASLQSHDVDVRRAAVRLTVEAMDVRAGKALAESLKDESQSVRSAALEGLKVIRTYLDESRRWTEAEAQGTGALSPLAALLAQAKEENPTIRLAAVRALGALGEPQALPALIELLRSDDRPVREAAQTAIDRLVGGAR